MAEFIFNNQNLQEFQQVIDNEALKVAKSAGYVLGTSPKIKNVKYNEPEYQFDNGEWSQYQNPPVVEIEYKIDGDRSISKRLDIAYLQGVTKTESLIITSKYSDVFDYDYIDIKGKEQIKAKKTYLPFYFADVNYNKNKNLNHVTMGDGNIFTEFIGNNNITINVEIILLGNFDTFYSNNKDYITPPELQLLHNAFNENTILTLNNRMLNYNNLNKYEYVITSINQTDILDKKNYIKFQATFEQVGGASKYTNLKYYNPYSQSGN